MELDDIIMNEDYWKEVGLELNSYEEPRLKDRISKTKNPYPARKLDISEASPVFRRELLKRRNA